MAHQTSPPASSPAPLPLAALHRDFLAEHPEGADESVHMLASIVDHAIHTYSEPGDVVLDPFAGFGTTLARTVAAGRHAIGVELLPERCGFLRDRVPTATVLEGDARGLLRVLSSGSPALTPGSVQLVLASPPYMTANQHEADPLTAYELNTGDYGRYLKELGIVAAQCATMLTPGGFLVWNLADIRHMGHTTTLIGDVREQLAQHLDGVETIEIVWDTYPHDLIADALLVFRRPPREYESGARP